MSSIVAYRNPLEQWFWEGGVLWMGAFLLAALVVACLYHAVMVAVAKLQRKFSDRRNRKAKP